jgi:hypothetical protein
MLKNDLKKESVESRTPQNSILHLDEFIKISDVIKQRIASRTKIYSLIKDGLIAKYRFAGTSFIKRSELIGCFIKISL